MNEGNPIPQSQPGQPEAPLPSFAYPEDMQRNPYEGPEAPTVLDTPEQINAHQFMQDEVFIHGGKEYTVASVSDQGKPKVVLLTDDVAAARDARLFDQATERQQRVNDARSALDATYNTFNEQEPQEPTGTGIPSFDALSDTDKNKLYRNLDRLLGSGNPVSKAALEGILARSGLVFDDRGELINHLKAKNLVTEATDASGTITYTMTPETPATGSTGNPADPGAAPRVSRWEEINTPDNTASTPGPADPGNTTNNGGTNTPPPQPPVPTAEQQRFADAEQTLADWEQQAAAKRALEQAQLAAQQAQLDAYRQSLDPDVQRARRAAEAQVFSAAATAQEPNSQHRLFGQLQDRNKAGINENMAGGTTELPADQAARDYILKLVTQHAIQLGGIDYATIMRTQKGAEQSAQTELHAIRSDRKKIPGEEKKDSIARLESDIAYLQSMQVFGERGADQLVRAMVQLGILERRSKPDGRRSRLTMKVRGALSPAYARSVYVPSEKPKKTEYKVRKEIKKLKGDELQDYLNGLTFPTNP